MALNDNQMNYLSKAYQQAKNKEDEGFILPAFDSDTNSSVGDDLTRIALLLSYGDDFDSVDAVGKYQQTLKLKQPSLKMATDLATKIVERKEYLSKVNASIEQKTIYWFDMDDVLFDFVSQFEKTFGVEIEKAGRDISKVYRLPEHNFFVTLPLLDKGVQLLKKHINMGHTVGILSSAGDYKTSEVIKQKIEALKKNNLYRYFDPANIVFVEHSYQKAEYAGNGNVLFDDRMKSIEPFNRAGGKGVLFKK